MRVGFLGFGEAAASLAEGLYGAGVTDLVPYDVAETSRTRERLGRIGRTRLADVAELAACDVVFSAVTARTALEAARSVLPALRPGSLFVDLNSCSPRTKRAIGGVAAEAGVRFAGAAVMSAVPPLRHRVPILVDGPGAEAFAAAFLPYGMRIEVVPGEIGAAATVKMLRSAVVKGLEALFLEALVPARRLGLEEVVLRSLGASFGDRDLGALGAYLLERHAVHAERRLQELEEVADTLVELGQTPRAVAGCAAALRWSVTCLAERSGPRPDTATGLLDALGERGRRPA